MGYLLAWGISLHGASSCMEYHALAAAGYLVMMQPTTPRATPMCALWVFDRCLACAQTVEVDTTLEEFEKMLAEALQKEGSGAPEIKAITHE